MRWKIVIPIIALLFVGVIIIAFIFITLPTAPPPLQLGSRKALILGSANDFYPYEAEDDFNGGIDSNFNTGKGNWSYTGINSVGEYDPFFGNESAGSIFVISTEMTPELVDGFYTLDYDDHYDLKNYAYYNMTAKVYIRSTLPLTGSGVRIGLQWLNSTDNLIRSDWSAYRSTPTEKWMEFGITGACNNQTDNEITGLKLTLHVNATLNPMIEQIHFDDVKIDRWIAVNVTDPIDPNPPPNSVDSDGFPAQALQVYWILRSHGYTDDNIFFMLYHTNDPIIDIYANDLYTNDLNRSGILADVDVENNDVNASRFKQELNVSISGSFASSINPRDQLIIFMTDHGSNAVLGDGNATFHFEADNSFITEFEFYDLVKNIDYVRMMINVDSCFSGNFLNQNKNIGQSWYNLPNCLFVSASSNVFSWYWINNNNGDGFAGSWFFHQFWEQLDQNQTVANAFTFASNFIPWKQWAPLIVTQTPLMHDNLGINTTWSFNSDPSL